MASRVVRDLILSSESLSRMSQPAEFLFWRLLLFADDYGCFDARSSVIAAGVFPARPEITAKDVEIWLSEIDSIEDPPIRLYEKGARTFGYFVNWEIHRGKSRRSKHARFPVPFPKHPGASEDRDHEQGCSGIATDVPGSRVDTSLRSPDILRDPPRCRVEGGRRRVEGETAEPPPSFTLSAEPSDSVCPFSEEDDGTWLRSQLSLRRGSTEIERNRWLDVIWPEIAAAARSEADSRGGDARDHGIKIAHARWRTYLKTGSGPDDRDFGIEAAAEAVRVAADAILELRPNSQGALDDTNQETREPSKHRRQM